MDNPTRQTGRVFLSSRSHSNRAIQPDHPWSTPTGCPKNQLKTGHFSELQWDQPTNSPIQLRKVSRFFLGHPVRCVGKDCENILDFYSLFLSLYFIIDSLSLQLLHPSSEPVPWRELFLTSLPSDILLKVHSELFEPCVLQIMPTQNIRTHCLLYENILVSQHSSFMIAE